MDQCIDHQMGYARAVQDSEGNRIASAFFMHAHKRIIYLKGSTSETGKNEQSDSFVPAPQSRLSARLLDNRRLSLARQPRAAS